MFFSCIPNQGNLKAPIFEHKEIQKNKDINIYYYNNGKMKFEIKRFNNKLDGCSKYWSEYGNLINEVCYENDILHGFWKEYFSSGETKYIVSYTYGLKDSYEYWYYENGDIKSKTLFKDGKQENKTLRWNEKGRLIY